jgi:hypothetical protein
MIALRTLRWYHRLWVWLGGSVNMGTIRIGDDSKVRSST